MILFFFPYLSSVNLIAKIGQFGSLLFYLSSCVDNDFFISLNCICCSFSILCMILWNSSMTFIMFSRGVISVVIKFWFERRAEFVVCGGFSITWFRFVRCFTTSENFSSGAYLRLIRAIRLIFVSLALLILSASFFRSSTSLGHPLHNARSP